MGTAARTSGAVVMVDVARRAGVSQKTVSRVINDAPHVRPDVRSRVLAAVAELGYRPNVAARALVTRRTHVIGVLAVGAPLFGPANRLFSLEHKARERGYELALATLPDTSPHQFREAIHHLLARGVEGLILEVPNSRIDVDETLLGDIPIASSVGRIVGISRQALVITDQVEAGRLATQHLINLGHETVWHITGPREWDAAGQRSQGWMEALTAARRKVPAALEGDWSARSGYQVGLQLADRNDVTAIFAANDHSAMGVMRAMHEHGRSVPDDVSVMGFDDVPEAEFHMVPLTTVRGDHPALSARVLSELVSLIEGGEPAQETTSFHCEVIPRNSTGPPRRTA